MATLTDSDRDSVTDRDRDTDNTATDVLLTDGPGHSRHVIGDDIVGRHHPERHVKLAANASKPGGVVAARVDGDPSPPMSNRWKVLNSGRLSFKWAPWSSAR